MPWRTPIGPETLGAGLGVDIFFHNLPGDSKIQQELWSTLLSQLLDMIEERRNNNNNNKQTRQSFRQREKKKDDDMINIWKKSKDTKAKMREIWPIFHKHSRRRD